MILTDLIKKLKNTSTASHVRRWRWSYDLEPNLSAGEKTRGTAIFGNLGRGLYGYYQDGPSRVAHNFHTSSVACLGLIGLTLNGEVDQANTWSTFASNAFSSYFVNSAYNPGGDYTEGMFTNSMVYLRRFCS